MARPISTSFTPEEREDICKHVLQGISEGRSVARILREDANLCSYALWAKWCSESDDLAERVERAREDGATKLLEEVIEISDADNADPYIAYDKNGKPYAKIDGDSIQRAKLRVYARERFAAMIAPRKFGQRLDVTSGGKPLPAAQTVIQQDNRINALLLLAQQRKEQGVLLEGESSPVDDGLGDIMS